jgi:phosphatidyl-myo-inositol dimannoside synthase
VSVRPGLAVISFAHNAGGIAYVGRLLRRAMHDAGTFPWTVELGIERRDTATLARRGAFAARVVIGQLTRRADWILYNHVALAMPHRAIPRPLRTPYGVFVHDVEAWTPDLPGSRRRILADASVVIANSRYTAQKVAAAHPYIRRLEPCPLGLFERPEPQAMADAQLLSKVGPQATLIVGRVASDERYKGHDELIEAWPAVIARCPDAQLLVAGWGDDIARLRAKADSLGIGAAVVFCGYVAEPTLHALFDRVALYAMPSAREGFGLVYLEAMRAGVPCIGSTLDAAADVIADGDTGFIVDRTRTGELADAIVAVLAHPERRAAMGAAGRRRFHARFTYGHFRERLYPILTSAFPGFVARHVSV